MTRPRIGITIGDPGGVGPEVTLKALSCIESFPNLDIDFLIFGTKRIIDQEIRWLGLDCSIPMEGIDLLETQYPSFSEYTKGAPSKENGEVSFAYFEEAVEHAETGKINAVVTAPISKHSWALAGKMQFPGHTEYFSLKHPGAIMFFWSKKLKVALFSHHISLKKAFEKIKKSLLLDFFLRLHKAIEKIQPGIYKYMVSGLNPHAGENKLMGNEEEIEISPAIQDAQAAGIPIEGPFPPDVIFRQALDKKDRIVIALYHDQGLIPFKLTAFDDGVNVTLGLPYIRTSPDHGTAFDIAGKGIANPKSMIEAIKLAAEFSS